jgi:murein DD-endopeptidase MepM/ murein hydrolase activator NlpD
MSKFIAFLVLVAAAAAGAWYLAGRSAPPAIEIVQPAKLIGQTGTLIVDIDTPDARLSRLDVDMEQADAVTSLFRLGDAATSEQLTRDGDRLRLEIPVGKQAIEALSAGTARFTVAAERPVLFGWRQIPASDAREVEVRLTPPQVNVVSMHHFINHGGSELVVYRVSPADVASGVRVGDYEYPGFPATGAGIETGDPGLRVAFFALLWNQPLDAPIHVFAHDDVGNETTASFDYRVFPKTFRSSRIEINDRFLTRVVPAILANSTELEVESASNLLPSYLSINRDLRRMNNETITTLAHETTPTILWKGPFEQLINTAVEAGFADQRDYIYNGEVVDHQVHLGFDLASTAAAPVLAANRGQVVYAGWLGIYGNCVILDHGMGLQSLYAHLSSIDAQKGQTVETRAQLGRSGATGLAGGDHLHFTILLNGNAVTPIDWWSKQWVEDRILRKLREAGAAGL